MNPITLQDGTQIDPSIVKVMKGIKHAERDPNQDEWNQVGDNGDAEGAYQWNKKTSDGWKGSAKKILGDENAPMTPENQNRVAYAQIKAYKDAGHDPEEIAALWNGAHKDKTTGRYVYNQPKYGEKFRAGLQMGNTQNANQPQVLGASAQPQPQGLGTDLANQAKHGLEGIKQIASGESSTGEKPANLGQDLLNRGAGVLHVGGAIGGAIGNVAGSLISGAFNLLPESIKKPIADTGSKAIELMVSTPIVQKGIQAAEEFKKTNPDTADALGDVFNIATVLLPTIKSVQAVKGVMVTNLASRAMATEEGAKIIKVMGSKGLDAFRPISEVMDNIKLSPNKKINPTILRDGLADAYKAEKANLARIIDKQTLNEAVEGNARAIASQAKIDEILGAYRLLPVLGLPVKEGLIKSSLRKGVHLGATGVGAAVGGPIGAMLGENIGSRIASKVPKVGLISKAMVAKSLKK